MAQRKDLAKYCDHTVLKPDTQRATVKRFCDEAKEYRFASVCVNGTHVKFVAQQLAGSGVKTCCVVGFPLGAMTMETKAFEAADAVKNGADEIDMVMNIGALKDARYEEVEQDIAAVVNASAEKKVKVIIETGLLTDEEKKIACRLAKQAGAAFVKTCTGMGPGKATAEDIRLMKAAVGEGVEVKASTGINRRSDALALIEAGATRLGTSKGILIVNEEE